MLIAMQSEIPQATPDEAPWTVLIVEDDLHIRSFFEASVQACDQLRWLGSAGSVREAMRWLEAAPSAPDVLLVDLGLPDGSGLDVIRSTLSRFPRCDALVISVFGDEDNVLASIEAGALGYIHKDNSSTDLSRTIVEMKAGGSPISPLIARRVLSRYRSLSARADVPAATTPAASATLLSKREHEVLTLIARGYSYAEIAVLNELSVHTVQAHIKNLYAKLAVHSKNEAVFEAMRLGLLTYPG